MLYIHQLIWDEWNVAHIARHDVTPDEVEEVCHALPLVEAGHHGRVRLIGETRRGRVLAVILALKSSGVYYPVTARPASRNERQLYATQKGGEAA